MSRARALACLFGFGLMATLLPSTPAAATVRHPWHGLYQCIGTDGMPLSAFRLSSHGRYVFSMSRKGQHLNDPVPGRWRQRGRKILFTTGVFKRSKLVGMWYPPGPGNTWRKGYIALEPSSGGSVNISCYPDPPKR